MQIKSIKVATRLFILVTAHTPFVRNLEGDVCERRTMNCINGLYQ